MSNLAASYSDLGRLSDALVLNEKTLEFRLRVLPEDHPDIGDEQCTLSECVDVTIFRHRCFHAQCCPYSRRPQKALGCPDLEAKSTGFLPALVARRSSCNRSA